ncbi:hypothetical protein BCR36DRAFT_585757 [Piromyces finnis]|uniref:Uncharacterized protein n=1 Tax=Piromyces finnis TaxID=1754191 RepID=A0A1Y1V263_9FUNG|nr:hypothetical protein BCR36DRAFT_585757 [Piromyces finnis]|eukprot:ORX45450.1 hypothetical protein BCR36DRAFT_585757 [Piromyces finnis]
MNYNSSENEIFSLQRREQELSELNQRTLENIQIEIKNIINLAMNSTNPNKVINALQAVELLSSNCNNDIRRYQDVCRELINTEKKKCQNEIEFVKQLQIDTDNSLERKILDNYITNRKMNRKSYWKSFQYLNNSDSIFVNKSPRNITAAELLVTNVDSFQKQEIRLQEQLTKILNELSRVKNEKDSLSDNFDILNGKLQTILIQKEDAEEETKLIQQKLNDYKKGYDDKLYEFKELENQLQDEKTRCANLEQQCQELTQQIDNQHDDVVSNLNEQVRELTEQCQQYEKEKRKLTLDYELSVQNYNSVVEKTDKDILNKNKELASVNLQLKSETELVEKLTSENKKILAELEDNHYIIEDYKSVKQDYEKANHDLALLNVNHLEIKKENEKLNDTIVKKNNHITSLKNYLTEVLEKNETLEVKVKEILTKWNEERNKLIAKTNIDHRRSIIDVSEIDDKEATADTVYYNDENQLIIKDINIIDSFESSETRIEMLHEIEKYKEEVNINKNLYIKSDTMYKDCLKKLEKNEESLHKMEEVNDKLEKRIDHIKDIYSKMLEAVQTESRIKINNLTEKLDYTNECLEDTKIRNSELEANLKDNVADEMNRILNKKEEEIENLRNELQQSISESNRNEFMERENQLKEKIRELEAMISSNEISWNKQNEDMNVLNSRNIELEKMIEESRLIIKSKEEQEEDKENRISLLEQTLEQTKKTLQEKENKLTQSSNEFSDMKEQYQHFNDRVKELSSKLEESTQIMDHLREENKTCQMDLLRKEEEIKALQEKMKGNQKDYDSHSNNQYIVNEPESLTHEESESHNNNIKKIAMVDRELSRKLSHANHEEIVSSLSNQIFKLYNEMDKIENEKFSLTEEFETLQKQKDENEANLNKELEEIRSELEINKETLMNLRRKFAAIEEETSNFKMENESLKRELERYQLKLENTNKKMLTMMEEHEAALKQKDEKYDELYNLNNQLRQKYNRFITLLKQKGVL